MNPFSQLFGLYIHWPYCLSKCPYCDFASVVCNQPDYEQLLATYQRDIVFFREKISADDCLTSIFLGGGTPSLIPLDILENLMHVIKENFSLASDIEISIEANPDAITYEKMIGFRDIGVNRLSIGVQSLNENDLLFLGRRHTLKKALTCIENAQKIFDNINIDLIYARPHQTVSDWEKELTRALNLGLNHYSLYQLTIEENTPFGKNGVKTVDEQTAVELYQVTEDIMKKNGVCSYEISNYAKAGYECRHNLTYWRGCNYMGIGPAAQGRLNYLETINPSRLPDWITNGPKCTQLTPTEKNEERIIMGLRLKKEGIPVHILNPVGVDKAIQNGWATLRQDFFYPTETGFLLLNQLILLVTP